MYAFHSTLVASLQVSGFQLPRQKYCSDYFQLVLCAVGYRNLIIVGATVIRQPRVENGGFPNSKLLWERNIIVDSRLTRFDYNS
jgi:hypothetical protein